MNGRGRDKRERMGEVCKKMNGDRSLKHAILSLHTAQRTSEQVLGANINRVKVV